MACTARYIRTSCCIRISHYIRTTCCTCTACYIRTACYDRTACCVHTSCNVCTACYIHAACLVRTACYSRASNRSGCSAPTTGPAHLPQLVSSGVAWLPTPMAGGPRGGEWSASRCSPRRRPWHSSSTILHLACKPWTHTRLHKRLSMQRSCQAGLWARLARRNSTSSITASTSTKTGNTLRGRHLNSIFIEDKSITLDAPRSKCTQI